MNLNKIFRWGLMGLVFALAGLSIVMQENPAFAYIPRTNLQNYSRNLEVLGDKDGSLDQLIGEIQGYRTFFASGAVVGTTISVPGILPGDTIEEVVVNSSACDFAGSTVIGGRAGEAQITLQSRICGINSTRLTASFTRKGTTDISSQTLSINTTGWSFEVKLATGDGQKSGDGNIVLSSGNAICDAINGHPWLGRMVRCSTVGPANTFSTSTLQVETSPTIFTNQQFWNGTFPNSWSVQTYQSIKSSAPFSYQNYSLSGTAITIVSSGNVVVSSAANSPSSGGPTGMNSPIQPSDQLEIKTRGYRRTQ